MRWLLDRTASPKGAHESLQKCGIKVLLHLQVFLCSALANLSDYDSPSRYPTALQPGASIVTEDDLQHLRTAAQNAVPRQEELEISSSRGGYNLRSTARPIGELHLTTRLAENVFLGRCILPLDVSCFQRVPPNKVTCS